MFDGHSVSGNEENEPKAKLGIHEFNADELDEVPQFVSTLKSNEADREGIDESKIFLGVVTFESDYEGIFF